MKGLLKVSAIVAVLAASATFASADPVDIGSWGVNGVATTAPPAGNNAAATSYFQLPGMPAGTPVTMPYGVVNSTFDLNPGTTWHAALPGSFWVSYNAGTGPGGSVTAPNGTYEYDSAFFVTPSVYDNGFINVLADDTTSVYFNGVLIQSAASSVGNTYSHCSDTLPNCITPTYVLLPSNLFSTSGINFLKFDVSQAAGGSTGLDFAGQVSDVPEPNTLMLLGTGLIGSAGALFRRRRA